MQTLERYFTLYERFGKESAPGTPCEVSLGQIAEALFCTERNAKLIVRKLSDEGLICWQAGRGRGNRSRLTFKQDRAELLLVEAKAFAESGEYKKAFELLRLYGGSTGAGERFLEWMNGRFGFGKEQAEGRDVLRLPVYEPILTLDPAEAMFSLSGHLAIQLFDRLVQYDHESCKIVPALAHYWESAADGREWTFYLRKGIPFHNGKELTAADVVFTLNRLRGKRNSWIVRLVEQVEELSPRVVQIRLSKPNRLFLRFLCSVSMSVLPLHLAGQTEEQFWRLPVGTGPFRVERRSDERIVLQANAHYYLGRPHLDSVDIVVMPQAAKRPETWSWQQLLREPDQREVKPENSWAKKESESCCTLLLTWNMNKEGLHQHAAFRHAVDRLLDRTAMVAELGPNRAYAAEGYFYNGAGSSCSRDEENSGEVPAIRELLKEAGHDGTPVTLLTYNSHEAEAKWMVRRCTEAGIPMRIEVVSIDKVHEALSGADAIMHAIVFPEQEVCLIENYEQEGSFFKEYQPSGFLEWIKAKIDQAIGLEPAAERQAAFAAIENRLKAEARVSFLLHTKFYTNYHSSFKGVGFNQNGWVDFKDVWRA
ncbi:SgrR family transcriptional regulator [Paenibacillus protaetiae]|uniref:SgrR family transcriptional regulator n=1 Tax=Paenibacillus protaetiae TaxID=2509456 RepID=A0A4P6F0K3_9BACL|nr:SgrR family transcriptional regulator [Paenibacillus protaetiae]QAY68133.1 SgrR family transcriptional regulator [Paenibacillus protaetiae]